MKKILAVKIIYYLFFITVIFIAAIIFLEIIDFPLYDKYMGDFFKKIIEFINF